MDMPKKKSNYRPAPISDKICMELEKKYKIACTEIRRIAKEMRLGRPKLEMHLIYMATLSKTK
jgi:hypothetical protein